MEREIVSADGTRLVARRTGDGIPIVMVHGSAGGLDSWDGIANLLADEFEVWVYARRGYPPSDEGQGPKTFADDVADAVAVASAVNGVPHLAGASYGATTALRPGAVSCTDTQRRSHRSGPVVHAFVLGDDAMIAEQCLSWCAPVY